MNWRTWLQRITTWDLILQVTFIVVMIIVGIVLVTFENCSGREADERAPGAAAVDAPSPRHPASLSPGASSSPRRVATGPVVAVGPPWRL